MNRWEYKAIITSYDDAYALEQMLNGLGKRGWELGCCTHDGGTQFTFIFKRRVIR